MSVPWVRMSGAGNELIILDAIARPDLAARTDLAALAIAMCDPETGIGADSLLILSRDARDAMRMRVINADGGTSAMCGNGLRCLARHAVEHGYVDDAMFAIITDAGPRAIRVNDGIASVDMGAPILEPARVPYHPDLLPVADAPFRRMTIGGVPLRTIVVSMGNPHAVVFVPDPHAFDLATVGPQVEHHAAFPERVNLQLVRCIDGARLEMRTWERGSGATLACGSGACAAVVAGRLAGVLGDAVSCHLPGGVLDVRVEASTGHVWQSGPAEPSGAGVWTADPAVTPTRRSSGG